MANNQFWHLALQLFLSFLALMLIVDVMTCVEVPSASSKIDDLSF